MDPSSGSSRPLRAGLVRWGDGARPECVLVRGLTTLPFRRPSGEVRGEGRDGWSSMSLLSSTAAAAVEVEAMVVVTLCSYRGQEC